MATGAAYVNVTTKRTIGANDFGARFLDYLRDYAIETNKQTFDTDMVHGTGLTLAADGNDKFQIIGTDLASDGAGHFLDADAAIHSALQFENGNTIDYYVAMKWCTKPSGIQVNPRTGYPEYLRNVEEVGEKSTPDSVVDNGNGTATFTVDSVTEAGVDNSGRLVMVYLKSLARDATTEAVAIETRAITYSAGNNKITTNGSLGQTTISTTASDYEIILLGPTVKRYVDLRTQPGYAFLGKITGAGAGNPPSVFDMSDQRILPTSWATALFDGLPHNLIPAADNTYSLGSATRKWSDIYTYNLTVAADFLPLTDNAQDLGSAALEWRNLYIDGIGYIDKLYVSDDAGEGVSNNLIPDTDDTHDLGSNSYWWKDLYVDGTGRIHTLVLSSNFGEGVGSHIRPIADDTYDLGHASYQWKDLFIDGVANIDTLSLSTAAGEGCATSLIPTTDDAADLGSSSYQWKDLYIDGTATIDILSLSNAAGEGVSTTMRPVATATHSLGAPSYKWLNLYLSGLGQIDKLQLGTAGGSGVDSDLVPSADDTYDLGSGTREFKDLFIDGVANIDTLSLSTTAGEGASSDLTPTANGTYNLGSSSYRWNNLYIGTVACYDILHHPSGGVDSDWLPKTDNTYDLGASGQQWKHIYGVDLDVSDTAIIGILSLGSASGKGIASQVFPTINNTFSLGSSSRYWANIYGNNVYYKNLNTFDNYDDLALVEAYAPSNEFRKIVVRGKERQLQMGNPETLPWPMLGPLDEDTGTHFLDSGSSIMFLLGAIKQLSQRHKKENGRLEGIILDLESQVKTLKAQA